MTPTDPFQTVAKSAVTPIVVHESNNNMDENSAKEVFNSAQNCLRLLNGMLTDAEERIPKEEFAQLRLTTANAMASIIDICEFHVYSDHPNLRPYSIDKKQD